jgi:hypothetical protein
LAIAVGSRTRYSIRNWNLAKAGPEAKKAVSLVVKVSAVRERGSSIVPEFRNKPHKK